MKIFYRNDLKKLSRKLRNGSTLSEVLLWQRIKGRQILGFQFMRQKPIENYIVDFFCSKLKLVIEVDGSSHIGKENEDRIRQKKLESIGLTFLRFDDIAVKKDIEGVLKTIEGWIIERKNIMEVSNHNVF
jgi:very-short-patch-repair endonuclease